VRTAIFSLRFLGRNVRKKNGGWRSFLISFVPFLYQERKGSIKKKDPILAIY